ncbi:hypothetical protein CF326_g1936 [Tilletia indica]|nr:hypothetical protein CF326_g1936 [Tilletia indica]
MILTPGFVSGLPGEVVLMILQYLIQQRPRSDQTLKALLKTTAPLSRLSWKLKLATDVILGLHFHAYSQPRHLGVHEDRAPWHVHASSDVALHQEYWSYYQGEQRRPIPTIREVFNCLTSSRLPTLRCVSLDLRPPDSTTPSGVWRLKDASPWIHSSAILDRMSQGSKGIEELNLRLKPQQELIDFAIRIIANNPKLRSIRVEVDSAVGNAGSVRPLIKLRDMFPRHAIPMQLERFVLRAPSCNVTAYDSTYPDLPPMFQHLRSTEEFVLVSSDFQATKPTVLWIHFLLSHLPNVVDFDFAVHDKDSRARPLHDIVLPMVHLHSLDRMSIQVPEIDTHLLRAINALSLYKLRIKSSVPAPDWPVCEDDHFPNLFIANIKCPGPSALRVRAMGVPDRWFYQNLSKTHNWTNSHSLPFLAYIKPYSRRRFEPPALDSSSPTTIASSQSSNDEDYDSEPFPDFPLFSASGEHGTVPGPGTAIEASSTASADPVAAVVTAMEGTSGVETSQPISGPVSALAPTAGPHDALVPPPSKRARTQ